MLFTSPIFLFLFLPVVLPVYFVLPRRWRNVWLMSASLVFYSWGEGWLIAIMLTSSLIDFLAGLGMSGGWRGPTRQLEPGGYRTKRQRAFLVLSLSSNIAILVFFKYFGFGVENYNALLHAIGLSEAAWLPPPNIVLPLGISFYTFQSMSYTIDVYRGHVRATRNVVDFVAFVTMFPQLVAGPIVRYADVARELLHRTVTRPEFAAGVRRFIVGLAKKMILANTVAVAADNVFAAPTGTLSAGHAWIGVVCYALQIYFDFSGYSDMAIGMGKMLGFRFLENFNYPYIARSVQDFWRRWHMSMSTWFRDYLYLPLGGNRRSAPRTYLNLIVVFFITGLWHGANWTFVVWGLWHGLFLIIERLGWSRLLNRLWAPVRHGYVLAVVLVGWVLFRAGSFAQALDILRAMAGQGASAPTAVPSMDNTQILLAVVIGLVASAPLLHRLRDGLVERAERFGHSRRVLVTAGLATTEFAGLVLLLGLAFGRLANDTYNPFIYFRF